MADRPTIYLTNAASRRPPQRGPGRVLTIMAHPRPQYGEAGVGVVPALVPPWEWVDDAKAGRLSIEEYRERYFNLLRTRGELRPVELEARLYNDSYVGVANGDTLVCACSREAAAAGKCHRVWAAELLLNAGWHVILDGRELPPLEDDGDDAVRDRVVYRSAHGLCCGCGRSLAGKSYALSFGQLRPPTVALAVVDPESTVGEEFRYAYCGTTGCAEWLEVQELLGRLPHQSGQVPRARWIEVKFERDFPPNGWVLEVEGERIALVAAHRGGWRAYVPINARDDEQMLSGSMSRFKDAQEWAELEVVRARRNATTQQSQGFLGRTGLEPDEEEG